MPLEDKDIFNAICARYSDQPMEFIMDQYEKAKILNLGIERRMGETTVPPQAEQALEDAPVDETCEIDVEPVRKRRYTKRSLKISPKDAITKDVIYCCLCEKPYKSITSRHLNTHGISVEDYKKLCGYAPETKLMSEDHLESSRNNVRKAQKSKRKGDAQDDSAQV